MNTQNNERTVMKIRIAYLEPGQRFRFGRTTVFSYEDQRDLPVLERETTNHIDEHVAVAIDVREARTYNQTGRRGRQYVITLDNGRQVAVTPQTKVELVEAPDDPASGDVNPATGEVWMPGEGWVN